MKKVFLIASVVMLLASVAKADPSKKLLQLFNRTFPNAEFVMWSEDKGGYLVTFVQEDSQFKIWYDKSGNFVNSIRYGQEKDLPLRVLLTVKKRFKDKPIFGVTELTSEYGVCYRLMLTDSKKWYVVDVATDGGLSLKDTYRKDQ